MYLYFILYDDRGAPSVEKFARSIGSTVDELEGLRKHARFNQVYRECGEIRKDYLIDRALDRRFDPSFVKFLLSSECEGDTSDGSFTLRLLVTE